MAQTTISSSFEEFQKETLAVVKNIYQKSQQDLWRFVYWEHLFTRVMAGITVGGFTIYLLFVTWNMSPNAIERYLSITWLSGRIGNVLFAAGLLILYLLIIIPIIVVIDRRIHLKKIFRVVYFVLLLPLSFLVAVELSTCYIDLCDDLNVEISNLLAWYLFINIVCLMLVAFWIYVMSQLPYWLFLVFAKPIQTERSVFLPSYDGIGRTIIEKPEKIATISYLTEAMIVEIVELTKQKYTSLGIQAQTFAPVISTFSLLGLFALLFTQQELRNSLLYVENNLGQEFTGVLVFGIVFFVFGLFYWSIRYFIRIIIAMRVLDIMMILLEEQAYKLRKQESSENKKCLSTKLAFMRIDCLLRQMWCTRKREKDICSRLVGLPISKEK